MNNKSFKKPTKQCVKCNNFISVSNINKHMSVCNGTPSLFVRHSNGMEVKLIKQITNVDWNEVQAFYNENHSYMDVCKKFNVSTGLVSNAIKKGLFKTRSGIETSRLKGHYNNRKKTPEQIEKIKVSMKKAVLEGRQKTPKPYGDRCTLYKHTSWLGNEEILQGGWEKIVANYLDEQKIKWQKPKKSFSYEWKGNCHQYFPDFFLEDFNAYIEVKGWTRERDIAKWKSFPEKLLIIDKDSINNLPSFFEKFFQP